MNATTKSSARRTDDVKSKPRTNAKPRSPPADASSTRKPCTAGKKGIRQVEQFFETQYRQLNTELLEYPFCTPLL